MQYYPLVDPCCQGGGNWKKELWCCALHCGTRVLMIFRVQPQLHLRSRPTAAELRSEFPSNGTHRVGLSLQLQTTRTRSAPGGGILVALFWVHAVEVRCDDQDYLQSCEA